MGIDSPEKLSLEDRNKHFADFLFLRKYDREFHLSILKQAISEALLGTEEDV